jgi:hypothetical protein
MDAVALRSILTLFFLRKVCSRVDEVAGLGRAVEASIDAGNPLKSVEIALGIEQPIHEVSTFLNALSMTLGQPFSRLANGRYQTPSREYHAAQCNPRQKPSKEWSRDLL